VIIKVEELLVMDDARQLVRLVKEKLCDLAVKGTIE
jgi:hypothetical protein